MMLHICLEAISNNSTVEQQSLILNATSYQTEPSFISGDATSAPKLFSDTPKSVLNPAHNNFVDRIIHVDGFQESTHVASQPLRRRFYFFKSVKPASFKVRLPALFEF
jgi:hypothetical protein